MLLQLEHGQLKVLNLNFNLLEGLASIRCVTCIRKKQQQKQERFETGFKITALKGGKV